MQLRRADLGKPDLQARTVPVVLATDHPVERSGFIEVLDVSRVNLSRGDLPLIESHDHNTLNIGIVRNIRTEGGKLRGEAVFGTSARASEVLADVDAGIVTGVSIGYQLTDSGTAESLPDGTTALRFGFMPYEVSAVAIPADPKAGFNRSHPITKRKTLTMENISTRNHAAEIAEVAKFCALPGVEALAMRSIGAGQTVEQFQQELIRSMATKPLATADMGTPAGATEHRTLDAAAMLRTGDDFRRHYSQRPDFRDALSLAGFLRGVARMKSTPEVVRALSVGVDASGGYAVPSSVMPRILEAMVPESSLMQAGAAIVPLGDAKSFSFAAVDTIPTAAWRAENGQVAESGPTFRNVQMTPQSLSFVVKVSRELLADGVNVESALQVAIAQAFAVEMDRAGLRGSGTAPEIRGLRNVPGVQTVTNGTDGAALAGYANFFAGAEKLMEANAPMPGAAIMSPRSRVKLGALVDTTGQPLQVPDMLKPVKLLQTSQVPNNLTVGSSTDCSEIYLGDFTQFVIGLREQVSIQVLEEAFSEYGQIGFMCHARLDVAALYPKAFCIVSGVR